MRLVSDFYREREALRALVRELARTPGALALDVGCKQGDVSRSLARTQGRLVALDLERHAEWAESDPRVCFLAASAQALPFADAAFDVVVSSECIQYVPDPEGALDEMARVLRPGGTLVLSFPEGNPLTTWLDPDNVYYGLRRRLRPGRHAGPPFVRHLRASRLLGHAEPAFELEAHLRRGTLLFIYVANLIDVVQALRLRLEKGGRAARLAARPLRSLLVLLFGAMNLDTSLAPPFLWYNNVVRLRKRGAPVAGTAR